MFHELTEKKQNKLIKRVLTLAIGEYRDCLQNYCQVEHLSVCTPEDGSVWAWPITKESDITPESIRSALCNLEPGDYLMMSYRRDPFYTLL